MIRVTIERVGVYPPQNYTLTTPAVLPHATTTFERLVAVVECEVFGETPAMVEGE